MSEASIQKIRSSHVKNIAAEEYAGYQGLIWFDEFTGELRIWDNNVPGGRLIYGNAGGATNKLVNGAFEFVLDSTGNVTAPGAISAVGNVTANYFIGDGSQLTNLPVGGSNITIQNQGNTLTTAVNTMNFTGNGVVASNVGNVVTVNITAGSGSGLPPQTGNVGKILSTNGVDPLWEYMPGVFGLVIDGGDAAFASTDFIVDGGTAA